MINNYCIAFYFQKKILVLRYLNLLKISIFSNKKTIDTTASNRRYQWFSLRFDQRCNLDILGYIEATVIHAENAVTILARFG